jgi:hypothetical protein
MSLNKFLLAVAVCMGGIILIESFLFVHDVIPLVALPITSVVLSIGATLAIWKFKQNQPRSEPSKVARSIKWLLGIYGAGAICGITDGLVKGWTMGHSFGLSFSILIVSTLSFEYAKQKKR